EQAHKRIKSLGIETGDIKAFDHQQKHLATFFFVTDPDGYKIEFLQRQGRYL
ncbi:lactoylglutathione lyase, partial [Vibrio parahaemolyticus]|nr:lactoylglutathione lyase [Vibrio parahaemolyticus]